MICATILGLNFGLRRSRIAGGAARNSPVSFRYARRRGAVGQREGSPLFFFGGTFFFWGIQFTLRLGYLSRFRFFLKVLCQVRRITRRRRSASDLRQRVFFFA